ncbi:hypothetical protein [Methylobacterium gnaphalii]|uniref:Uncharacterized protein n=1 Tax=Methylobacterium gnaphalii TaxID=1010610 RepID=A0A512JIK9_9HYPH|nr:hypothetical protein [Methylobacterium gnaphalii]GEP09798.1 hypothetical protein MGN01_16430 [Methylobacterium gnaphalii]GJD67287.1 hypothetical protein MMMDOFMJ_0201 [Methylobacterium gnaphalii]GLS49828.1 hypothetical protein GCM10007885_26800 [Methylobacterium gnaphalii]
MQTFAHVVNGVVREIITLDDTLTPGVDVYTPSFAQELVVCSNTVKESDLYVSGSFSKPQPPPATVPSIVSSAQAKIQLTLTPGKTDGKSLFDDAKALVDQADVQTQIWFSDARTWMRDNVYVNQIAAALGLSSSVVDELFTSAATIGI